jgi:hypothetical protein
MTDLQSEAVLGWAEPPTQRRGRGSRVNEMIANELKAHQGLSGIVAQVYLDELDEDERSKTTANFSNLSAKIRHGLVKSFQPKGAFDSRTVTEPEDRENPQSRKVLRVYAMYRGLEYAEQAEEAPAESAVAAQ